LKAALIIAEDPAVRRFFNRALGYRGWWVDAVESIESGLIQLQQLPRDLVLLDWQAESGTGLIMLLLIRSDSRWRRAKVVMLHSGPSEESLEIAGLAGADGCLAKPNCGGNGPRPASQPRGNCYCGSIQFQPVADSVHLLLPKKIATKSHESRVPLGTWKSLDRNGTLDTTSATRPHFPYDALVGS
jgi:CheY-like chemotaxis protein